MKEIFERWDGLYMTAKLVELYAHIEPNVNTLSLPPVDMSALSEIELNIELEKA